MKLGTHRFWAEEVTRLTVRNSLPSRLGDFRITLSNMFYRLRNFVHKKYTASSRVKYVVFIACFFALP